MEEDWIVEGVMEEVYSAMLKRCVVILEKINPLQVVLGEDTLKKYTSSTDVLRLSTDEKLEMKKMYKNWCRKHHPDKWEKEDYNKDFKELCLHIQQVYGDAILSCDEEGTFDSVWLFMGYAALKFNGIIVDTLSLDEVCQFLFDADVLSDILEQCYEIKTHIEKDATELKHIFSFMEVYLNAKESGICTLHSHINDLILQEDCQQCKQDLIIVIDDEESSSSNEINESDENNKIGHLADVSCGSSNNFSSVEIVDAAREVPLENFSNGERFSSRMCDSRAELDGLDVRTLKAIAESLDLSTDTVIEKLELVSMIINEKERQNVKYHRKRENPTKFSLPISTWSTCIRQKVDKLPFYVLSYDNKDRMKSSVDGRNWSWKSSSRVGFQGLRRTANCNGGHICENETCDFLHIYKKQNAFHFRNLDPKLVCKICNEKPREVECLCKKIWEFDVDFVTVYHWGNHKCVAKPLTTIQENELRDRFFSTPKVTPQQAVNDIIGQCLDDQEIDIDRMNQIIDSSLDKQKVKNFKKKVEQERRPLGHSFEAVSHLKTKLAPTDKFFVYKLNNREMNGAISFVFKTSKPLIELALAMDKDGDGFLSDEYAYFDGTHKRCPGFVTLCCHVYVNILNMTIKLFSMETEDESEDCTKLCWTLFNSAIQEHTGDKSKVFNPTGWVFDEAQGFWNGLKTVFGQDAVERSVSCEWHFGRSYISQAKFLRNANTKSQYQRIAKQMLEAATPKEYGEAITDMENFISENNNERGYLFNWLAWWDERRSHFSKAFKHPSAPAMNLSEVYNSKYVKTNENNLKLIDAAKRDIIEAMKFGRAIERFGEGANSYGTGPSSYERVNRDIRNQKKRATEFADEILNGADKGAKRRKEDDVENNDEFDANRRKEWRQRSKGKSSSGRASKYRSARSQTFLKSLKKAQENKNKFALSNVDQVSASLQKFHMKVFNQSIEVTLADKPSCSCKFFERMNRKNAETCCHIIWVLLYYYQMAEEEPVLQQVALTPEEIGTIFALVPDVSILRQRTTNDEYETEGIELTAPEQQAIFESKGKIR